MPMQAHSILVGKTYRAVDEELRSVLRIEDGDVIYTAVTPTPGQIARHDEQRQPVERFAHDVDGEIPI